MTATVPTGWPPDSGRSPRLFRHHQNALPPTATTAATSALAQPQTATDSRASKLSWASATPESRRFKEGHARRWYNKIHMLHCGQLTPHVDSRRKARDWGKDWRSPVIHFSTAPLVHNWTAAEQRICLNHPQACAQDASLAPPGASVIGARSPCWSQDPSLLVDAVGLPAIVSHQAAGWSGPRQGPHPGRAGLRQPVRYRRCRPWPARFPSRSAGEPGVPSGKHGAISQSRCIRRKLKQDDAWRPHPRVAASPRPEPGRRPP